jgi:hypothetical protein
MTVSISLIFIGDVNKIDFRQFTQVLARFRRGKATTALNTKEQKLLFLFSVRFFSSFRTFDLSGLFV